MDAKNWEEWWDAARPVWRDWWSLAKDGCSPPDDEEWSHLISEYDGFRLLRRSNSLGRTEVTINGPRGTECTVTDDSLRIAGGVVPLHFVTPADTTVEREATEASAHGRARWNTFEVVARFPNGRSWRKEFFWSRSATWTIDLMSSPKVHASRSRLHGWE
jgi:hypothetical protein